MMNSTLVKSIKQKTAENRNYLGQLIQDAVRINSYPGEEEEIQYFLKSKLEELGMETRLSRIKPEKLEGYRGFSYDGYSYDRRYNLLALKKGVGPTDCLKDSGLNAAKSLILNGHVDVVPPGDPLSWQEDPLSGIYREGKVYGRGALDMKGGLAAGITAIKVLQDIGFKNRGDIFFASVCGEETGGCGAFALIEEGIEADGCLILEPTNMKICHLQSGCHTFKIIIRGRSIHACMAKQGISAIDKFYIIYRALKKMDRERHENFYSEDKGHYADPSNIAPLSIGTVNAGEWPSTVPDYLEAHGRMGIFPGETVEEMHRAFEETVSSAAATDPWLADNLPRVEWYEGLFEPSGVDRESDLIKTLAACHRAVFSRAVEYEAVTYGSDMRIFNLYGGIPTVMYGPGDVTCAHTANEHIAVDSVLEAVSSLALMLTKWC